MPRALLADDEALIRTTLATVLAEAGFEVVEAADGDQAVALLDQCPDLVVTDIRMPGRNGWQVAEDARARCPEVAIIYITGFMGDDHGKPVPGGIKLQKPFKGPDLLDAIRFAIDI